MSENLNNTEVRWNYGIDLLRIVCMVMIPTHHVLLHGGILQNAEWFHPQYKAAWFLEISVLCAVNVYGIISGYVGYGRAHRLSRFIKMYIQLIFYTLLTTAVFAILRPKLVTGEVVRNAIFPFGYEVYWYCTAYFCLFFFMPVLDRMMERLDRAEARRLLIISFILFSVMQTVYHKQFAHTNEGYSFLWMALMYIVGAYIRKYDVGKNGGVVRYLLIYILSVMFVWLSKTGIEHFQYIKTHNYIESIRLVNYTSPFIIICAVCLVLAFKNLKIGSVAKKAIIFFSPVAFDVYLFHDEPLFRENIITGAFTAYLSFNSARMLGAVIGTAGIIWICGSLVGRLRICFFKLLKVDNLSIWAEKKVIVMARKLLKI